MTKAGASRIYVDANLFIYAAEGKDELQEMVKAVLALSEAGFVHIVTSELSLAEILVRPLRIGNKLLARVYEGILSDRPGLTTWPVTRDVLRKAADLRSHYNTIKLPDAIHLATALTAKCSALVSNDRRFPDIAEPILLPIDPGIVEALTRGRS